jgi:SAM-dependent methyltransferase
MYDEKYYAEQSSGSYHSAKIVLPIIFEQLGRPKSLLDVGCGTGTWLKAAKELVPELDIQGVDHPQADKDSSYLVIPQENFIGCDLTQALNLERQFDLVLSLEVAEHLEPQHADQFIANLVRHGNTIVFSAAIPGQGGVGHYNERFPEYWVEKFKAAGYICYDTLRPKLWLRTDIEVWYQQNIMIFSRLPNNYLAGLPSYRAEPLVHPILIRARMNNSLVQLTKPLRRRLLKALGFPRYRKMHIEQW